MIKYVDSTHIYFNENGDEYTSVTRLVKKYEPYKDWDEIAKNYAKKHKKDVEEVKAQWKKAKDDSIDRGHSYHKDQEAKYPEGPITIGDKTTYVYTSPLVDDVKVSKDLKNLPDGIYPELIVYSDRYKVAGQADYVEKYNNTLIVHDYKTNKVIEEESYKHWKTGHRMMSPPLNNLMDSNYWHYALQLNIYMFFLKSHNPGCSIGDMILKHYGHDLDFWGNPKIKNYTLPNLQSDVKRMLDHYASSYLL
jgi:ATP-dependent exoDNAse (exonuclease V) beta subunit